MLGEFRSAIFANSEKIEREILMAEVLAVEVLLENLKQLLLFQVDLIKDAKNQLERLENKLLLFKAFLKGSTKKQRKDESLRLLFRQIRNVVYEAEDIIDILVMHAVRKPNTFLTKASLSPMKNLRRVVEDAEEVSAKVMDLDSEKGKLDFSSLATGDRWHKEYEDPIPIVRRENIVGFEDEAETLIGYLTEETEQLDVISIIGMAGLGKTMLARKIFGDPVIQFEFPTRIWIDISQEFSVKEVFLGILREFTQVSDEMYRRNDKELAQIVVSHLEKCKFMIVMDDVWTAEDWHMLEIALPKSNKRGKVLITSCDAGVAIRANHYREPHRLRFLSQDESWLLFQYEVFGKPECPPELEYIGKLITNQCTGLPLALVVMGGLLVKETYSAEMSKVSAWEKISRNVSIYLQSDPERHVERIISLSYDNLPLHLRACFLYLGMFPEGFEISVRRLIRLWIAEGFIQQNGYGSLENIAENYLEDLIGRNLVTINRIKLNGKVKTCRVHDILHQFCKVEAEREYFLQEINKSWDGALKSEVSATVQCRRVCLHSNVLNFLSSKPQSPHVRSFVCFSKEDINLPPEICSSIPAGFKLLKVLDVKPIRFTRIPSDLYYLIHLKYLALFFNLSVLPAAFSKLGNMQTLIVDTACRTLEIKADIWKLIQLRYLKTNVSATLPKASKTSEGGEKLHTLTTISPQNCTENIFDRARNLKKLGIRGRLSFLMDGKAGSFDSLARLTSLENLKLLNDVFPSLPSEGQLCGLPNPNKFPPNLRSLTLANTFLDWSLMFVLGSLENLEVLKLKDRAFMGERWDSSHGGFPKLEVLLIGRTNLVNWEASGHHFPKLRKLLLLNCNELQQVPIGLADIPSLQLLELYRTSAAAVSSAEKIRKAKQKQQEELTNRINVFKLSLLSPESWEIHEAQGKLQKEQTTKTSLFKLTSPHVY